MGEIADALRRSGTGHSTPPSEPQRPKPSRKPPLENQAILDEMRSARRAAAEHTSHEGPEEPSQSAPSRDESTQYLKSHEGTHLQLKKSIS